MQQPEEGLSNEDGQAVFKFRDVGVHYIRAEKQGYLPLVKKINLTKEFLERGYQNISIPLIRDDLEEDEAVVVLNADCDISKFKLFTLCPKRKQNNQESRQASNV